jgi:hypothetical protein
MKTIVMACMLMFTNSLLRAQLDSPKHINQQRARFEIIDTAVLLVEKYANATINMNVGQVRLSGLNKRTFCEFVSAKHMIPSQQCASGIKLKDLIKGMLREFEETMKQCKCFSKELQLAYTDLYHHTWMLFNCEAKNGIDFDYELLTIYHQYRVHVRNLEDLALQRQGIASLQEEIRGLRKTDSTLNTKINQLAIDQSNYQQQIFNMECRLREIDDRLKSRTDTIVVIQMNDRIKTQYVPKRMWHDFDQFKTDDLQKIASSGLSKRDTKRALKKAIKTGPVNDNDVPPTDTKRTATGN